ncbi:MAG: DNA polymerase III subunit delta [Proteobacteria bacterium]|nr:DNA polymerase III subunit delta [Pseudomonadota bacterium]
MNELGYTEALAVLGEGQPAARVWVMQTDASSMLVEVWRRFVGAVAPEQPDFNVATVECRQETGIGEIEAMGEELPLMSERRVLWIRDIHRLDARQGERLTEYLASASPQTWFFVSAGKDRGDGGASAKSESGSEQKESDAGPATSTEVGGEKRRGASTRITALKKSLGSACLQVKAEVDPDRLPEWIEGELAALAPGATIARNAAAELMTRTNKSAAAILTELEKLVCYVGDRKRVEESDVRETVADNAERMSWNITDALERGDEREALVALHQMLEAEVHPLMVLGWFSSRYRTLLKVKGLAGAGESAERISSATRWPSWKIEKTLRETRAMSVPVLERTIEEILAADLALKTGNRHERFVLELLIMRLSGLFNPRRGSARP